MQHKKLYILMIFAMVAWGETWVSAKILSHYLEPMELIFWRFLFSAIGLIPVIQLMKLGFGISLKNLLISFIAGVLLIVYNNYFFMGTKFGKAGFGGILVTTLIPINTFIILSLFFGKKTRGRELFALLLGVAGTMTMLEIWRYDIGTLFDANIKYFLLASIVWPLVTIVSSYTKDISALVISFYMFLTAACFDFALTLDFHVSNVSSFDGIFWLNMLLLSLWGTTFGTSVYFIATAELGAKTASSYFFLVPLSAALFSVVFLNEVIQPATIVGGFMTMIAVYIINGFKARVKRQRAL
ncbi:MAG: DMT family transporter [Sulfurovaceae bacterium]